MYKYLIPFIFCIIFSLALKAQPSLTFATGIAADINSANTNETFSHIPFTLIWKPSSRPKSSFFFKIDYAIPVSGNNVGDAYTLNPSLPAMVTLPETVRPYLFTVSLGLHIHLYTSENKSIFFLDILPVGICSQNFKVTYKNYDKVNYEVLNPDVDLKNSGYVAAIGVEYLMHMSNNNSLAIMLHAQSPLAAGIGDYDMTYRYVAPLQLTVGYNFFYNKKRK